MHQLGDVLLHVDMVDAQRTRLALFVGDRDAAAARQRQVRLRKLVTFGQIGVVVDLLVKGTQRLQLRAESQAE